MGGDCGFYEYDDSGLACCPQCCPTDPNLECQSNYCGGCNRLWFSSERSGFVQCEQESTYSAPRNGEALAKPAREGDGLAVSSEDDFQVGLDDDDSSSASRLSLVLLILLITLLMY